MNNEDKDDNDQNVENVEFYEYIREHFFDDDRDEICHKKFPLITKDIKWLNKKFDILSTYEMSMMMSLQCSIPIEVFQSKMFPKCSMYNFPSLSKDNYGFFLDNSMEQFTKYSRFVLSSSRYVVDTSGQVQSRHRELEDFIWENKLDEAKIDLQTSSEIFITNECCIYPDIIKHTLIHDILYYAEYTLHTIWKIMSGLFYYDRFGDLPAYEIAKESINNKYHTRKVEYNTDFINTLSLRLFQMQIYNLNIRKQSEKYGGKKPNIQMSYPEIRYEQDEDGNITIHNLIPLIDIKWSDGTECPHDAPIFLFKKYMEKYYEDVKNAFPIFERLEMIYKLCLLNRLIGNVKTDKKDKKNYSETYPENNFMSGGIHLYPDIIIKCPKV